MLKTTLGLISALLIASLLPAAFAEEGGDVCNIRPDLCDESGGTPEPEVAESIPRKPRPAARKASVSSSASKKLQQQRRKVKPSSATPSAAAARKRSAAVSAKCRKPGQPYNLNDADLPLCKEGISIADEAAATEPQSVKKATRSPASVMNIDAYLNANANHPAFAKRLGERQKAFQEQVRPATISTGSESSSVSTAAVAPADPAANKAPESAAPQQTGGF